MIEKRILVAVLCSLASSCSEMQDDRFPGPLQPVTELDCNNGVAEPPMSLGVIDGWGIDTGWESRIKCEHRHSHGYVDNSIPGNVCLGFNREVGAFVAHAPIADGPGTYTAKFAAQMKNDQLINVTLSRGTDDESPDWARSVSLELECFQPCASEAHGKVRQCRPVVRLHDTPELKLAASSPHGRYEVVSGHSDDEYEIKCALNEEHGFPLPTTSTVTAEIIIEGRSVGWKIDGALVSGFGPAHQVDRTWWSCERTEDGSLLENAPQRLFVSGLPFAEVAKSPNQPGYELAFEHWSPDAGVCPGVTTSVGNADGAWMCVRDARYASCSQGDCPEACGDGTCDIWETHLACATDCKIPGPKVPDLAIASMKCGQSVTNGGSVSCDVVIVNQGTGEASEFENKLWFSPDAFFSSADLLLGNCISGPIDAGAMATVTCSGSIPIATTAGTWYLGLGVDSSKAIDEFDENNNFESGPISVVSDYMPPPDLVISSVDCFALTAGTGEEVDCWVTAKNIGAVNSGPFLLDLRLSKDMIIDDSDALMSTCEISTLFAGSPYSMVCTGKIPIGTPIGTYYFGVIADNANAVSESNENNNTAYDPSITFVSYGPADLVVTSVDCPSTATSPGSITCSATLKNQGDSTATFVKYAMRLSNDQNIDLFLDKQIGECDVQFGLSPGQSKNVMCTGSIPDGQAGFTKYVGIVVDSTSSIPELDEKNNSGVDSVSIQQGPADLIVTAVDCPMSVTSPGSITCSVTIKNQGNSVASFFDNEMRLSNNTTLDFGDTLLDTCSAMTILPNQTQTIMCTGNIPSGIITSKYIVVKADSTDSENESDENNNTNYTSVSIQPGQADLVVTSLTCPLTATSPGSISCTAIVKNQGTVAATFVKNELYLSDDPTLGFLDTSLGTCDLPFTLAANSSQSIMCNGSIPANKAGFSKYVIFEADSATSISESNENNNTASRSINVQ